MFYRSTTGKGFLKHILWSFGCILMCMGITMPDPAFSALTSVMPSMKWDVHPMSIEQPGIKTRPAFDSTQARNVCVRVTNTGTRDVTVWLLHSQSVVGLFTVHPQHISGMCTVANKIELGCSGDSCESTWAVFDTP